MDFLTFLYHTVPGRILLRPLSGRTLSRLGGKLMDTRLSGFFIPFFVKAHRIDLSCFETEGIKSFNDFFTRKIKPSLRPCDPDPGHLIAPCDGLLSVWEIREDTVLPVKQSVFTIGSLLRNEKLARHYQGGTCLVFRLCVDHYHRYCYADSGRKSRTRHLAGRFHTVRPVALAQEPVFTENTREYTLIRSDVFGSLIQMEVGAMLVGRICNNRMEEGMAVRGTEKGMFRYGGSTIILLLEKDRVKMRTDLLEASRKGEETPVKLGEMIGEKR